MDFDPDKFDRDELKEHLHDLGVEDGVDYKMDELLTRTTKNTRTGNEFGFKPVQVSVGSTANGQFYSGFDRDVEPSGYDATSQAENHSNASSFWIRFKEEVILSSRPISSHRWQIISYSGSKCDYS